MELIIKSFYSPTGLVGPFRLDVEEDVVKVNMAIHDKSVTHFSALTNGEQPKFIQEVKIVNMFVLSESQSVLLYSAYKDKKYQGRKWRAK